MKTKERLHLVYGICLSVLILAVGVCFALSCLSIYRSGTSPFTRESIAVHFDRIAIPVYLCMAGVLGGMVLSLALPLERGRIKPQRSPRVTLAQLSAKLDMAACEETVRRSIRREQHFRRGTAVTVGILSGLTMAPAVAWCVNPAHFSIENLNGDIRVAALLVTACAAVTLGLCVAAVLLCSASASREISVVKTALASGMGGNTVGSQKSKPEKKNWASDPRVVWGIRGGLLAVGAVLVVLGVRNGGMADVLGKAIRICTECIGLG